MPEMKLVVIESPFAGATFLNRAYAGAAMAHSLSLGEAPFASHLLYTQILDDLDQEQRKLGMEAGFAWGARADLIAVYTDLGISSGMEAGIARAERLGKPILFRSIPDWR